DLTGSSTSHPAVYAEGGSTVSITNCRLHDLPDRGIEVVANSVLQLTGCEIEGCGNFGVMASGGSRVMISGSRLHRTENNAVVVSEGSEAQIRESEIWDVKSALAVLSSSKASLAGSSIHDLRGNGVYCASKAQVEITGTSFARTEFPAVW